MIGEGWPERKDMEIVSDYSLSKEENELEEIGGQSSIDEEIDSNRLTAYDIAVFYNTYNLSTLLKWWGAKLVVPSFQRAFVWNIKQASEFVDSMLRGLPVPSMFFYDDTDNGRMLVIDGQQRLTSLYQYIESRRFGDKVFKLTGNIHEKWKNKTFDELDEDDRSRLEDALLNITVMRQLAPDDGHSAMYMAFQRINTGGISLKAQEIRMAVSYGEFAKKLSELSRDERFERWRFLRTNAQRAKMDYSPIQEFILKFWVYYLTYPNYSGGSTRAMLDYFFDLQKDLDEPKHRLQNQKYYSWAELMEVFNAAFDIVLELSDEDISPFNRPTQTYLEAIWVGLTYRLLKSKKEINTEKLSSYIKCWKKSLGEDNFSELFQARRTSSSSSALERISAGINYFEGDF